MLVSEDTPRETSRVESALRQKLFKRDRLRLAVAKKMADLNLDAIFYSQEFRQEERRRFGDDGFETIVERVGRLEQAIGIYDLKQFSAG